jgi:uncharacterized protein YndB with AHSA1/START domain
MKVRRIVLLGGGAVVALIALVAIVGALLPETHQARRTAVLAAPPDSVWAVVRDFGSYAAWWPDVRQMTRLPDRDGHEVWRQTLLAGAAPIEIVEVAPPRRLVARIADEDLPFGGTWTYELEPASSGTRLTVTEDGVVYNPMFRFVARFITGYAGTIESYERALARRVGGAAPGEDP